MRNLVIAGVLGGAVTSLLVTALACSNLEQEYVDRANEQANGAGGTGVAVRVPAASVAT